MTPEERRILLAFADRRHAANAPEDEPLGLAALAGQTTDTAVVRFMAEWLEAVLETSNETRRRADALAEIRVLELERRTAAAIATRQARSRIRIEAAAALKADGLSIAKIALQLKVEPRTVERWLAPKKVPTGRRNVGPDVEMSD